MNINKLVRPNIANLKPYQCARYNNASGILLNANENPYGRLNRYPDPLCKDLKKALADYAETNEKNIFVGNGSDEIIDLLIRAFCDPGKDNIFIKRPSYGMYEVAAAINNIEVSDEINEYTKLIFLCSPNNPSGEILSEEEVLRFCENECLVVLDEAYIEFSSSSSMALKRGNLVVLRTLSKAWGGAGIRLGYSLSNEQIVKTLNKIKFPYNVNVLTQKKAAEILKNPERMRRQVKMILEERARVKDRLEGLGLKVWDSRANFLLFEVGGASNVQKKLESFGLVLRDRSSDYENALRVTIGTKKENNEFLKALEKCLVKVAFLDRDGVLIYEPQDDFQVDSLKKYKILDGVKDGLRELVKSGYKLVMITNQDGMGSGHFPEKDFLLVQNQFLRDVGVKFDEVFVCTHFAEESCNCRKPKTGMVDDFLNSNPLNMKESFVVGDRDTDMEFARNIGVKGFKQTTNNKFVTPKL